MIALQDFAMDFLPFSNSLRNLSGVDEFKTDENRKAFLSPSVLGQVARARAAHSIGVSVYQAKTSLPPYDRERGASFCRRYATKTCKVSIFKRCR